MQVGRLRAPVDADVVDAQLAEVELHRDARDPERRVAVCGPVCRGCGRQVQTSGEKADSGADSGISRSGGANTTSTSKYTRFTR